MFAKILVFLPLMIGLQVHPVFAQQSAAQPNPLVGGCSPEQRTANRAWSIYIAKNPVSDDENLTHGARIQGLSSLLSYCMEPGPDGKPLLKLTSLNSEEISQFASFVPDGPMANLAKCLVDTAPAEAKSFIVDADRLAFKKYITTKGIGAFPDDAFVKLLEASDGCGDLLVEPVKSSMLYADVNWYIRVEPKRTGIVDWLTQAGVQ